MLWKINLFSVVCGFYESLLCDSALCFMLSSTELGDTYDVNKVNETTKQTKIQSMPMYQPLVKDLA